MKNVSKKNITQRKPPKSSKSTLYVLFTAVAAVMVIAIAAALKIASDSASYSNYYNQGVSSYEAGDYSAALSYLRKADSTDSTDECRLLMADCYRALGKLDKALDILKTMDSNYPEVAYRIADIEAQMSAAQSAETVTVNGRDYPISSTSLSLDQSGLGDNAMYDISRLYALSTLSLSGNSISSVAPLATLGGLTTLNISWNTVSDISPLVSLTELRTLYLDGNPISDFSPLYSLNNLSMLSIKNIPMTEDQRTALSAALPNCAIHSDAVDETDPEISLGGVTFKASATELNLSDMGLYDISALSACKSLVKLDLSNNYISDITALMDIPSLQWLDISDNSVSDLRPLMGMSSLENVYAGSNGVSSTVPLGSLTSLRELYLGNNPIYDYSGLSKLRMLETLDLENTDLTDDDLTALSNLTNLRLLQVRDNPQLTGNAVDALDARLNGCRIDHSELAYYIELGGQRFLDDITELNLTGANITDISPITGFKNLQIVKLGSNAITNIYTFDWMDCSTVTYLDLSGNGLTDAASLANFRNLETLVLTNNQLSNINGLILLKNLKFLYIEQNLFTEETVLQLRNALPNCTIYADY